MEVWENCISELINLLESRDDLKAGLEVSIQRAALPEITGVEDYYYFLSRLLTEVPVQREMSPLANQFHFLISQSTDNILKLDLDFRKWLRHFSRAHGSFLDTVKSAANLSTFINSPEYNIGDYDAGASGWLTFNQFFARHVKPGKRPVAGLSDNAVIVSPTDSIYKGCWNIDESCSIVAKGNEYKLKDLLAESRYAERFKNGVFTHSYLDSSDYHRYHVPVTGIVREVRKIPGDVIVDTIRGSDGELVTLDEVGFQFTQTRGMVIIDSPIGLVAVLPIGMGHVSSVNLTVDTGSELRKGEEFGYFAYGGSDMVTVFELGEIDFSASVGTHYKQGEQIARARPLVYA